MKGYKFRLAPVLHVRRLQEEQARAALAHARLEAARASSETTRRRGLLGRAREMGLPSARTSEWRAEHDHQERLTHAVLASRAAELRASELVATRIEDWNRAAQEVAALEKLDDKAREAHVAEMLAQEQRDNDEQAAARHTRAQRQRATDTTPDDEEDR